MSSYYTGRCPPPMSLRASAQLYSSGQSPLMSSRSKRRHEALGGATPGRHRVARVHEGEPHDGQSAGPRVISLTQRRLADPAAVIAGLPADTRPLPSVRAYDQLLRLPERTTPATAIPAAQKGTAS